MTEEEKPFKLHGFEFKTEHGSTVCVYKNQDKTDDCFYILMTNTDGENTQFKLSPAAANCLAQGLTMSFEPKWVLKGE